jgi:hypothetical protein
MDAAASEQRKDFPMVAPLTSTQRIVCTAVRVDAPGVSRTSRIAYKPSELVPWADPYIAGLVRRLQSEVRFERAELVAAPVGADLHADLEPPSPAFDADWDAWDQPRWNDPSEPTE